MSVTSLVWRRLGKPAEFVEGTRWLFTAMALVSVVLTVVVVDIRWPVGAVDAPVMLASAAVLVASWTARYLRRRAPLAMDVVEAVATLGFAVAIPEPAMVFAFACVAQWFGCLYGSTRRALLRAGLFSGALVGALALWPHVSGHGPVVPIGPMAGVMPAIVLVVVVLIGPSLADSLRARERAALLDAVHVAVGSQLLDDNDEVAIRRIYWAAAAQICRALPGLSVSRLVADGALVRSEGEVGLPLVTVRISLAALMALVTAGGAPDGPGLPLAELDLATGAGLVWKVLPLPPPPDGSEHAWLLLGGRRFVPPEAVISFRGVADQVTLALRNLAVYRQLTVQATHDSLTGLVNRASFTDSLSAALASSPRTTVLFVDLDDFKGVNDVYGHGAGDDLLRQVTRRMQAAVRPGDVCARLGGDEFGVLLPGATAAEASQVAGRIIREIAAPVHLSAGVAHVGASVGIASTSGEANLEQLIHHADVAMYTAKAHGKSQIQVFEPALLLTERVLARTRPAQVAGSRNSGGR